MLCRRNLEAWSGRWDLEEAAAWTEDGAVTLSGAAKSAFAVETGARGRTVTALSMDTLVARHVPAGLVDYLKVDIEGAEQPLLSRNAAWASRVRCISVEVHAPYDVDRCAKDLEGLGFNVATKPAPRSPRVVGLRT